MRYEMTRQVLLGLESFITHGTLKVERVTVSGFMALHVRLLNKCSSANVAFVRLFSGVQLHVSV